MDALTLFLKALAPGERWITVRPNGPGTEGHAVLVKPAEDGSMKIIGGAGGALNHLRLTGVKSEADYAKEAGERQAAAKVRAKLQKQRDREYGLDKSKKAAREAVQAQVNTHRARFVDAVGKAMGWSEQETRFPVEAYQNASEAAVKAAARKHANALFVKAKQAVRIQRERLAVDAGARAEAGLGEVPLETKDPASLSVQDLSPVTPETKGFGYTTDYGKRAAARGASPEDIKAEAAAVRGPDATPKAVGVRVADELSAIRAPAPQVDAKALVDARQAVELLKAEKALRDVQKQARDKNKQIAASREAVEPKAYVIETGGMVDDDVVKDLDNDLRTIRTRAFLDTAAAAGGSEALGRHIGVGAFNSINALALATTGASLVDRSVVDVLGIAGAAQVLARRLHSDLTPQELENTRQAMGAFHVDHYMKLSDQALREAREWQEAAQAIEVGDAATGADFTVAQELNRKRRDFIAKSQTVLGSALGEMEANAALVVALEQPAKGNVKASLGATPIEQAIKQARAIGLDRGDYSIERAGASTILTVHSSGLDKLAAPVSRADLERTQGALDIIEGRQDEDGWLPGGVASRPDMALNGVPGVAPRLGKAFRATPGDQERGIRDYIGGRMADGDSAADIVQGLLSEDVLRASGDRQAFMAALDRVAPLYDGDGKMIRAEAHQAAFEAMADEFVEHNYGGTIAPLHRQQFAIDPTAADALHRALAAHPDAVAAFKPVGDLSPKDQGALRAAFLKEFGRVDPEADKARKELEGLDAAEPEREVEDMFGRGTNPEWTDWKGRRDAAAERVNKSSMTWGKYLEVMGSPANAYASMQDVIRSKAIKHFADTMNRLKPESPLKVGRSVIANDLDHLDALDPEAREKRLAEHRGLVDRLRNRVGGKYASGSVSDKIDAAREAEEATAQSQMGLFGAEELPDPEAGAPKERALELGERYTIGHAAERQLASMMPVVGANFRPGQPVEMWRPDMSGAYVGRQRAVKLIEHNQRTMLGLGVGSGKTSISLAGFTNLKAKGKAKRGLFLVPSIVQGEFHGQALTLLKPGEFNWHANPGASREERIAHYRNPNTDFSVVTHQAFRDDMVHLAAEHSGVSPADAADRIAGMQPEERSRYLKEVMEANGIDHDYVAIDEGHNILNREGKEDSRLSGIVDGVTRNTPYYVNMTADPVKNDASEIFDVFHKMDPVRYPDRDAFMRKYGVNTAASKDSLRREMARYFYTGKIDPGVQQDKREVSVKLSPEQHAQLDKIDDASARAKIANLRGTVDVDAMRTLSPGSFAGVDPAQHEDVARTLQRSAGIMRDAALHSAVNGGAKTEALADLAGERRGKPGVVFVHRLDRVDEIANRLRGDGHKVVTLTGGDSTLDKDRKKRAFQAGEHDIIVCSDAGAVGANLQRGQWLAQYDSPMTAMTHAQRNGRIARIGQKNNVELLDLVADHPEERRARQRLQEKYELRSIMTSPLDGLDDTGVAGVLNRIRSSAEESATPAAAPAAAEEPEEEMQGSLF